MQWIRGGTLCGALVLLAGCTTGSQSNPATTTTAPASPSTQISTVTTAPPTSLVSTTVPPGQVTPTVVVPRRPAGLAALELDDTDLGGITLLQPSVQGVLPHDRTAVTEGLTLLDEDRLLESTGFYGRSSRRVIGLDEGSLDLAERLQPELYATGIALVAGSDPAEGLQFTRLEGRVHRFDPTDLSIRSIERFEAEVNGVCSLDDQALAVSTSDGDIQIVSTTSLEIERSISPSAGSVRLPPFADLSCVSGEIWGIVGETSVIAGINAETGAVESFADLSELTPAGLAGTDVLSGLTFRPTTDTWFVTGKRWDVLYEISLAP